MNRGIFGAIWGVSGVLLLLGSAVYRLSKIGFEACQEPWQWYHAVAGAALVIVMAWSEGYRGFQQAFSPRVAARARFLRDHPVPLHLLLAPLFCMGYFHATRRRQLTSWSLTLGIIALVVAVRHLPQPWRGIVDIGVVVGLAWGIASVALFAARALSQPVFAYSPEVPTDSATITSGPH